MISSGLKLCPDEAELIGAMLSNYGELEFCLTHLLGTVLADRTKAFRLIYKDRGEDRRINVCDTLMRSAFGDLGLGDLFIETINQVRHCKILRNQYAHSWFSWSAFSIGWGEGPHPKEFTLKIVSLEEAVSGSSGMAAAPKDLPLELLRDQLDYFLNAREWLIWLQGEYSNRLAKEATLPHPGRLQKPKRWVDPKTSE